MVGLAGLPTGVTGLPLAKSPKSITYKINKPISHYLRASEVEKLGPESTIKIALVAKYIKVSKLLLSCFIMQF